MLKKITIWCDAGLLTCKNVELKFTEYGMIVENSEEEIFIPYSSMQLARGKKDKGRSRNVRLQRYDKGGNDCI